MRVLGEVGFAATEDDPERRLAVRHSLAFRDAGGHELDLHRGLLWRAGLDEEFWQGSIEAEVAGARVRILNPADQLLHVCAHGAAWNPVHPLRWAADAFKVIEAADAQLDWERLVAMARLGHLSLPLADALSYLAEKLEAPVPEATRRELSRAPVSRGERRAHKALARPPSPRRSLAMLSWFRERYRAEATLSGTKPGAVGFAKYMQAFWGLEQPSPRYPPTPCDGRCDAGLEPARCPQPIRPPANLTYSTQDFFGTKLVEEAGAIAEVADAGLVVDREPEDPLQLQAPGCAATS